MGNAIYYSSTKKKIDKEKETTLQRKVDDMEKKLDETDVLNEKEDILSDINEAKLKLDEIYDQKVRGMMIRSRAKWIEEGEKPTKYFL